LKRVNFGKEYEAQRRANAGLLRHVLPWPEPDERYRALYNEVRLGLVVELQRISRIPVRYQRDADRELLSLVFRLLGGTPAPPTEPGPRRSAGKRWRRPAKLSLVWSRDPPRTKARGNSQSEASAKRVRPLESDPASTPGGTTRSGATERSGHE
jgi:hypothetical protein